MAPVAHPLPQLLRQGLRVTLNTDDPPMFNTDPTQEHAQALDALGLSLAELRQVVDHAVQGSFLVPAEKAELATRVAAAWPAG